MAGLDWQHYGILLQWVLLTYIVLTNYFRCVAATARTMEECHSVAMPGILLFTLLYVPGLRACPGHPRALHHTQVRLAYYP